MSHAAKPAPTDKTLAGGRRQPPVFCRNIKNNGFCVSPNCRFMHPKPCKNGANCTKDVCKKPHPVPKCPRGAECGARECQLRHPARELAGDAVAVALPEPDVQEEDHEPVRPTPKTKSEAILVSLHRKFQQALDECDADVIKMREQIWDLDENTDADRNVVLQHIAAIEGKIQQIEFFRKTACNAVELALKRREPDATSQYRREIFRLQNKLPALAKRTDFANAVRHNQFVVVRGETGSGKSTQLTQFLLDMPEYYGMKVICTQPRKVAALSLAERVAYEFAGGFDKAKVGGHVGYRMGSAQRANSRTCIEYVTESVLLKLLNKPQQQGADPLKDCCAVIIDEAHTRSINTDVLMGFLKREIHRWPYLKVIVTSATINTRLFSRYFHDCPVVEIPGRLFPVDVVYRPFDGNVIDAVVKQAVQLCQDQQNEGHILCFLTGQKEVETAAESARNQLSNDTNVQVHCLYGKQVANEQRLVFEPVAAPIRKLIFATDVAETSVTIDDVRAVIDCGLTKNRVFDVRRKVAVLKEMSISKTSAIQRKGRAGRTAPGVCYRLYSQGDYAGMPEADLAEVFSKPLSITVAMLKAMNVDPTTFNWIERPKAAALAAALEELRHFGAVDQQGNLTDLGRLIAELQIDPGIANMIQYACTKGLGETAIELAALFSVSSMVFWRGSNDASRKVADEKKLRFASPKGDIVSIYRVFQQWKQIKDQHKNHRGKKEEGSKDVPTPGQWCLQNYINNKAMEMAVTFVKEVGGSLRQMPLWSSTEVQNKQASDDELQQLVLYSLLLNLACLVKKTYVSVMNDVVGYIHPGSVLFHQEASSLPKVIVFQTIMRTSRMFVSQLTPIDWKQLKEINGTLYDLYQEKCKELHISEVRVDNVGRSHLSLIVGRFNRRLDSLNTELGCFLHADYDSEALVAWCKPRDTQRVERELLRKVEEARRRSRLAVVEEVLIGRTRLVWGCGGVALSLLFGKDFVSLNIRNVPASLDSAAVESLVARVTGDSQLARDTVRKCYAYPKKDDEETNCWRVFVKDTQAAEKAVKALNGYKLEEFQLEAAPASLYAPSSFRETCGFLKISFATAPSNGTAVLMYETPQDANRVLTQRPYPLNFVTASREKKYSNPPLDANGCFLNVAAKKNQKFVLYANRLPKYLDEEDIAGTLETNHLPPPVYICVARKKEPSAVVDSPEDVVNRHGLAPFVEKVTHREAFNEHKRNRAGVKVFYDSVEDVQLGKLATSHKRICDQPVRYETGFTTSVMVARDLYELRKKDVDDTVKEARAAGMRIYVNPKRPDNRVAINIQAGTVEELETVRKSCNAILDFVVFKNPNHRLLLTNYGKKRFTELLKKEPLSQVFVYRNPVLQTLSIYGTPELQQKAIRKLDDLIKQLETTAVEKQVLIRRTSLPHVANSLKEYKKNFPRLVDIRLLRNRLVLTGSPEATQGLETMLEQFQLTVKPKQVERGECGICFDTLQDIVTLELCNHKFCLECIRPMLDQLDLTVPIKCPYDKCETPLSVSNIQQVATPAALERMKQVAVTELIKKEPGRYAECFQRGCPQYLPIDVQTKKMTSLEQVRCGGHPVACDYCAAWYCASCSVALQVPVKRHRGLNCAQRIASHENEAQRDVRMHRLYIVETICTLHCPRCQKAFVDFDGCCALTCSCKAAFCFFCLQDCGTNAHGHVTRCTKNPSPGQLYLQGGFDQKTIHSASRKRNIIQYLLDKCSDQQLRKDVLEAIQIDIKDLGFSISPEEVRLFAERPAFVQPAYDAAPPRPVNYQEQRAAFVPAARPIPMRPPPRPEDHRRDRPPRDNANCSIL